MSRTAHLNELIEKTSNYDKDERYMATNDLSHELENDIKIDGTLERRICHAVLKQLDDASNDVQSIAVKCLSILVKKVQQPQVVDICDKLCNLVLTGSDDLRDIYSIGLKTAVSDLPESMGPIVAAQLTSRLVGGVGNDGETTVKLECLDLLVDLLKRFGQAMETEHTAISQQTLRQLNHDLQSVRKRATVCLGWLATVIPDALLHRIMETLLTQIESRRTGIDTSTYVNAIGSISRHVGFRLGSHLARIVPLFLRFLGSPEDEEMQTDEASELRENILHAFESFVLRCPREVSDHLEAILEVVRKFIKYDPNYSYDDSDSDEDMDDDEDDEDFSDDDFSDDDDTTWKVRRASIKVLNSVIVSRPELLEMLYNTCSDLLLERFKEREENVKLDILSCFTELLRATVIPTTGHVQSSGSTVPRQQQQQQRSSVTLLRGRVGEIVRIVGKLFKDRKGTKAKTGAFSLLREMVSVLGGGLEDEHIALLVPQMTSCMKDRNSTLKLEALMFMKITLEMHSFESTQPHIKSLCPVLVTCVSEEWYKIVAEALRVVRVLVGVIRPRDEGSDMFSSSDFEYASFVDPLYEAVFPMLEAHDIDQEIKEAAISAVGTLISTVGDELEDDLSTALPLLHERLRNEITRMPTLRALAEIANSPLKIDLSCILDKMAGELSDFLRQQSRALKQSTLHTLDAIVKDCGETMEPKILSAIVHEASALVSDADLHLAHLALRLSISVLCACPASAEPVRNEVLPKALALAASPVLHGLALQSLLSLFKEISVISESGLSFDELLGMLLQPIAKDAESLSKQAVSSIAQCVAVLCVQTDNTKARDRTIQQFMNDVSNEDVEDSTKRLALLSLGDVGRQLDLAAYEPAVHEVILKAFDAPTEEMKSAAATALGSLAVGNMSVYLPVVMDALQDEKRSDRHQYLLLSSLREIISRHTDIADTVVPSALHVSEVMPVLEKNCENPEEGVRNMVAECLGKLVVINPNKVLPHLAQKCGESQTSFVRWTLVTAIKYSLVGNAPTKLLESHIGVFFELLRDDDLAVRRAALLTLNSAAHHQPSLVKPLLADGKIMRMLFEEMAVKDELKRKVDLGPFKHLVDDGLPLRKAAFACMGTILDSMPDAVPELEFLPSLEAGLRDVEDIQMVCHQIISQLAAWVPLAVLAATDTILDPLSKALHKKVKESSVGTEVERANDVIRSALRALDSIANIPESVNNRKLQDLILSCSKQENLRPMMNSEGLDKLRKK